MKNRFSGIAIFIFIAVTLLPLLTGLIYALLNSMGLAGILSDGFTTAYWKEVFGSGEFRRSFFYSLFITAMTICVSIAIALFLRKRLKNAILNGATSYVFYIPLAIPFIVAAFLSYQLLGQSGFFARIAYALYFIHDPDQFPDLVNDANSIGLLFTHIIIASVFFAILFASIFNQERLDEMAKAATTLGADKKTINRKIITPVILSKATPAIILYAIFIFGSYEIPLLLGRQDPQMISVTIARKFQRYNLQDVPVAYAMAAMYTLIILLILFILYKRKKLVYENN